MVDVAVQTFGGLDVYVNCAGIYEPVNFLDLTEDSWRRTLTATLDAQVFVSVAVARRMAAHGVGRIILISSTSSPLSEPNSGPYSAAKAAVSSIARSIAVDLSQRGITANAVAPGWIHTDLVDDFAQKTSPESLKRVNLLGRMGRPDEVASVVEYLAADAPQYLTGTTIYIDGGQTAMALLP
jgi:NAD(P)-dependent dehydrogenase (short-subunit alcohol dehydrogenase family)